MTLNKLYQGDTAMVMYQDGSVLYICNATMGSALSSAVWQIQKIDTTSGVVIQWADGNNLYDNTATSLAIVKAHSYS